MMGHVSTQFHVVFDDDFSTIDDIRLPGEMTGPGQWKDLCHASNDSCIEERHEIENLRPTFDPKDIFDGFYEPTAMADVGSTTTKVTFATPIATYKALEGAETEPSEGVSLLIPAQPPKILEPIHTRRSRRLPKPENRLIAGLLTMLVMPNNCNPLQPASAFSLAATPAIIFPTGKP